jgi:hypothetical protein
LRGVTALLISGYDFLVDEIDDLLHDNKNVCIRIVDHVLDTDPDVLIGEEALYGGSSESDCHWSYSTREWLARAEWVKG